MATIYNGAEYVPTGATPSSSNSGGGTSTALNDVVINGGTVTADTTTAAHGLQSYLFAPVSGQVQFIGWTFTATASGAARAYIYLTAVPSISISVIQQRNSGTQAGQLVITAAGKLQVQNQAGGSGGTSTASVPLNQWVRHELLVIPGTTSSNGTINAAMYSGDSTTAIETITNSGNINAGTTNLVECRFGKVSGGTFATNFWVDDIAFQDAAAAFIGPFVGSAPTAPTGATATAGSFSAFVSWTAPGFNGGSALTGNTITGSPSGSQSVGGSATSGTVTGLTPGTSYTFTVHATNAIGSSPESAPTSAVTVVGSGQAITPATDITTSGWSGTPTGSPLTANINESSFDDSSYITSPVTPTNSVFETKFNTPSTPADNNGWGIQTRMRFRSASSGTATIALVQGTTIIASTTVSLTSSFATYTLSVTSAQAASISNLTDLRCRLTVTAA